MIQNAWVIPWLVRGLDLGFTAVQLVEVDTPLPELQELSLRLVKMPLRQVWIGRLAMLV